MCYLIVARANKPKPIPLRRGTGSHSEALSPNLDNTNTRRADAPAGEAHYWQRMPIVPLAMWLMGWTVVIVLYAGLGFMIGASIAMYA